MILGQELDIKDEFDSLEDLTQCYLLKTGCLFAAALEMAALIADRKDLQESMRELGYNEKYKRVCKEWAKRHKRNGG